METKADYKKILPFVIGWEGGESDHKADKGGLTNRGITYTTYNQSCKKVYGKTPSKEHFLNLTYDEVGLMVKHFWNQATFDNSINSQKISEAIFNWNWGSSSTGLRWFQEMINKEFKTNLVTDGIIGNQTVNTINTICNDDKLFRFAIKYRHDRFHEICKNDPSQKVFLKGWLSRLADFAKRHGEGEYYLSLSN